MEPEERDKIVVSKRLVIINSGSSIASRIINITVILWSYQYLLARISAEEFAILPVVTALMVFAPLFFSFFTGGIARYVVAAYANNDFERITRLVSSVTVPLTVVTGLFFTLGAIFAANISDLLSVAPGLESDAKIMMILLVSSFSAQMLATPFTVGYHVLQNYVELNLIGVARDFIRVTLLFVFLLGISPEVIWVVVATTFAEALHTIITVLRSRKMLPELRFRRELVDLSITRSLFSFGLWTTLGRLGAVMYTNAATILLNLYGTAVGVTSYHIGATFFRQIESTVQLAIQPLQTILTAMHTEGDDERLSRVVFRGGRYALWSALLVASPLALFSHDFVALYLGAKYAEASLVILCFMSIFFFTSPTALLAITAMAKASVREFYLPAFLFQLAGLVLMVHSITQTELGSLGMALSLTAITITSQLFYYWKLCLKLTSTGLTAFSREVLIPGLTPSIVSLTVCFSFSAVIPTNTWALLAGNCMLFASVYFVTLLCFCLNVDERADLYQLARRFFPRWFNEQTR